jgi:hypothetical protein
MASSTDIQLFRVKIETGQHNQVSFTLPNGETLPPAPFTLPNFEEARSLMQQSRIDDDKRLKELGQRFKKHLLPGALGAAFDEVWASAQSVYLHLELPDFATQSIPWEYVAKNLTYQQEMRLYGIIRATPIFLGNWRKADACQHPTLYR